MDDSIPQAMKDAGSCEKRHHMQIFEKCFFLERKRRLSASVGGKYISKCLIMSLRLSGCRSDSCMGANRVYAVALSTECDVNMRHSQ